MRPDASWTTSKCSVAEYAPHARLGTCTGLIARVYHHTGPLKSFAVRACSLFGQDTRSRLATLIVPCWLQVESSCCSHSCNNCCGRHKRCGGRQRCGGRHCISHERRRGPASPLILHINSMVALHFQGNVVLDTPNADLNPESALFSRKEREKELVREGLTSSAVMHS